MTTHDQQVTDSAVEFEPPRERDDLVSEQSVDPMAPVDESVDESWAPPEQQQATPERTGTETAETSDASLFADHDLADLRSRWDNVQAGFVDDPKQCVQKADGLVSDVVDQLTNGFSQARSRLEEQWARGEDASTEDLRVALTHYREFFQRLLAV